jgi:hypothetical protein
MSVMSGRHMHSVFSNWPLADVLMWPFDVSSLAKLMSFYNGNLFPSAINFGMRISPVLSLPSNVTLGNWLSTSSLNMRFVPSCIQSQKPEARYLDQLLCRRCSERRS